MGELSAVKGAQESKEFTQTFNKWVQGCSFASVLWECSGYHHGETVCLGNAEIQLNSWLYCMASGSFWNLKWDFLFFLSKAEIFPV